MFEHRKIEVAEFIFDPKVSLAPAGASRSEPCYLARNWRSDTKLHFPSFPSPFITSYHITHCHLDIQLAISLPLSRRISASP